MKIIVLTSAWCGQIESYLDFNSIDYEKVELWDPDLNRFDLSGIKNQSVLFVADIGSVTDMLSDKDSKEEMIELCQQGSRLWLWTDCDSCGFFMKDRDLYLDLDTQIPKGSVVSFIDGRFGPDLTVIFTNIRVIHTPYPVLLKMPRIRKATVEKFATARDFMLTMILKENRPHRDYLWNYLNARSGLLDRGIVVCHQGRNLETRWVGDKPSIGPHHDSQPSMDLYRNAWMELVPETNGNRIHYITEKTMKPWATKTPSLVAGNCGYLEYLRSIGFKTFGHLIDESYDQEPDMAKRMCKVIDSLQDIIKQGARDFYNASQDILDYNQNKLFEITGKWQYSLDLLLASELERAYEEVDQ